VVEADVLQRVGYGTDYVVLADDGHSGQVLFAYM
jgi:hypothetical protein